MDVSTHFYIFKNKVNPRLTLYVTEPLEDGARQNTGDSICDPLSVGRRGTWSNPCGDLTMIIKNYDHIHCEVHNPAVCYTLIPSGISTGGSSRTCYNSEYTLASWVQGHKVSCGLFAGDLPHNVVIARLREEI